MIAVLAIASALVGALGSAVATGRARRSLAVAGMTASFLFAASGAIRAVGGLAFAWWPGWRVSWSLAGGGGLVAAAVAGAYLAELLARRRPGQSALLVSAAGALWAALGGNLETVLLGWVVCWVPLLAILDEGEVSTALAGRNLLAGLGLLLMAALRPGGPWMPWFLPAGLVLAAGIFPAHAWLGLSVAEGEGTALLHGVATKLPLLFAVRSGALHGVGDTAAGALQVLAVLGAAHAMLVAWTYRRRPRAFLASSTVLLNATLLLAALGHGPMFRAGGLLLGSAGLLAQTAAWWALDSERWDLVGGAGWALVALPGSGLLPGLLLVLLGSFVPGVRLPHARATALVLAVGWFLHAAALVRVWAGAMGEGVPGREHLPDGSVGRRTIRGALLALGLCLLLGLWPRFWIQRTQAQGLAAETSAVPGSRTP